MTWYTESGACAGTDDLLNKLFAWMATEPWGAFAGSWIGELDGVAPPTGNSVTVSGNTSFPRWSESAGVINGTRQKLWRFTNGDVDLWLMLDTAYQGAGVAELDHPNCGIFALLTEDLGKTASQFKAMYEDGHPAVVVADNVTAPRFSSCYPTYGAAEYDFFSNGQQVHVSFKRVTPYGESRQHFSFGTIRKASAAWDGGEYFSGCCAPSSSSDQWDYENTPKPAGQYGNILLSSNGDTVRFSTGTTTSDPCGKGQIRVAGIPDANAPLTRTVKYCAIGDIFSRLNTGTELPGITGSSSDAVGSVAVLGGHTTPHHIVGRGTAPSVRPTLATQELCPNTWDNRSPGVGADLLAFEPINSNRWQLLGTVDGIRFLNVKYLSEGQVVNTDWKVYPVSTQAAANRGAGEFGNTNSGNLGIAYRFQ
jgi:hypothetical protein